MYRTLLALALTAQAQLAGKPTFTVPGVVNGNRSSHGGLAGREDFCRSFRKLGAMVATGTVMCSALVVDLANSPPTSMASLQVVAGTKQK